MLTGDELAGPAPLELSDLGLLRHLQLAAIRSGLWAMLGMQLVRSVPVAQPAAGAEWTQPVSPGAIWEVLAIRARLTTSATVANRTASVVYLDADGNELDRFGPAGVIAASSAATFCWSQGYGATNTQGPNHAPLPTPALPLIGGWSVKSLTSNIDATDQLSGLILTVREWTLGRIEQFTELLLEDADSTGLLGKLIGG